MTKKQVNFWVAVGAVVLIILLLLWLTFADLAGDTDVAAWVRVRSVALLPESVPFTCVYNL